MNPNFTAPIALEKANEHMTWSEVILVDEQDRPVGTEEKLQAHVDGKLHRAFSVFLFNQEGELLLQQRASHKYHSPDLWTNTCCSHPQPNRDLHEDAVSRMEIEMGISCEVRKEFEFVYHAKFENGLTEYEYDHVFFGDFDGVPVPNPEEVRDWRWASLETISAEIESQPELYTVWFRECFQRVAEHRNNSK